MKSLWLRIQWVWYLFRHWTLDRKTARWGNKCDFLEEVLSNIREHEEPYERFGETLADLAAPLLKKRRRYLHRYWVLKTQMDSLQLHIGDLQERLQDARGIQPAEESCST